MKKSIETKQMLLGAVKELLKTQADIRVKDITDTAFVNIAAVNYHFDDKDKLVDLAMQEIFDDFKKLILDFDVSHDKEQSIDSFIDTITTFTKMYTGFFRRLAKRQIQGVTFMHDGEYCSIVTTKMLALCGGKQKGELLARFASALTQIIFSVLFYKDEIEKDDAFAQTYRNQIKNNFS